VSPTNNLKKKKISCPGHFREEENLLPVPEIESWIIQPVLQFLYQSFYPDPVIS
jgi:hypothetical protein